jgi:hypothetical protein
MQATIRGLAVRRIAIFLLAALWSTAGIAGEPLRIEREGTDRAYFSYHGAPLLSFGGLSDFLFWFADDAHDFRRWADWAAAHGMNHIRAYPPLSWKNSVRYSIANGGRAENVQFPYRLVDGSMAEGNAQFDLLRFDERYWQSFRERVIYLQSKGIIVHLLMWNNWQLRDDDTDPGNTWDWDGHFFNPANNVNDFTDHLNSANRTDLYHAVADGRDALAEAQRAFYLKLIDQTYDLDNVYYDLVHELAEHRPRSWRKAKLWIDSMAQAIERRWNQFAAGRPLILGMDTGGLGVSQRTWIFTRPYFDVLIYGKKHSVANAVDWRIRFDKPYIGQESWDDDGTKYTYGEPADRVHLRKYLWKFMMAKVQQMDMYAWLPGDDPRSFAYDPHEHNLLEDDARVLRALWQRLVDYPNLWFDGFVAPAMPLDASHEYLLSSSKEALAYISSPTGIEGEEYVPMMVNITDSALADGAYTVDIIKPDRHDHDGLLARFTDVTVADGSVQIALPAFTDDIAVHIY